MDLLSLPRASRRSILFWRTYTVFVKQYTLGFMVTALLLWAAASLLDTDRIDPRRFARISLLSGVATFFSVTSVFTSFTLVNLGTWRGWRARFGERRNIHPILWTACAYNLLVLSAYVLLRNRANEHVQDAFSRGFVRLTSFDAAQGFIASRGRHLLEASLPSWTDTRIWRPDTASWTLPILGIGLVWLLARRSTRTFGVVVLGFYGAFLAASALRVYPLGLDRTDIFAFPVGICLFVAGIHALTAWIPKAALVRTALGVAVVAFAIYKPIPTAYWDVDDDRLIERLEVSISPEDGLILSGAGAYLASYYGNWPVEISNAVGRTNATQADIVRDRTLHLHPGVKRRTRVERFLKESRPTRLWYVAFRTGADEEVLDALADHSYVFNEVERSRRGRLYFLLDRRD